MQREKHNHFHIRFLSAKPIRMALARDMILKTKGDADRAASESLVQQADEKNIVLTISLNAEPVGVDSIRFYWSVLLAVRTPDLAKDTFLATKTSKRVYLSRYQPPGEDGLGAKLFFPRSLPDGRPLVTPDDRELRFETKLILVRLNLQEPGNRRTRADRIWAKFKVSKMIFQGKLEL